MQLHSTFSLSQRKGPFFKIIALQKAVGRLKRNCYKVFLNKKSSLPSSKSHILISYIDFFMIFEYQTMYKNQKLTAFLKNDEDTT